MERCKQPSAAQISALVASQACNLAVASGAATPGADLPTNESASTVSILTGTNSFMRESMSSTHKSQNEDITDVIGQQPTGADFEHICITTACFPFGWDFLLQCKSQCKLSSLNWDVKALPCIVNPYSVL